MKEKASKRERKRERKDVEENEGFIVTLTHQHKKREIVRAKAKIESKMTTSTIVRDQNLEKHIHKQMGCMAGLLNIFDRHQILAGKRVSSAKRLPPPVTNQNSQKKKQLFIFLRFPHLTHFYTIFFF